MISPRARWLIGVLLGVVLSACHHPVTSIENDAYVWQRQWNAPVREAVLRSADLVSHWRVLAAQLDAKGHWVDVAYDRATLAKAGKPVILVVRIDGQLSEWHADEVIAHVLALRAQADGWRVSGIEIDHDCATSKLTAYTSLLMRLRQALGDATSLSITALPTWIGSPSLGPLLAQVDDVVLQVHAVQSPTAGLFDPALAQVWVDRFADIAPHGFHVALPAYGTRVSWDAQGRPVAIASETSTLDGADDGHELAATPQQVATLLSAWRHEPPKGWRGVAWFRLPTSQDARAWSPGTWRAVVEGRALESALSVQWRPNPNTGSLDVVLRNDSEFDTELPGRIALPASCTLADGANGYMLDTRTHALTLAQSGWLRGQGERMIGWVRCPMDSVPGAVTLNARP